MSDQIAASTGRIGLIMRVLPHGTVMVWEPSTQRAYPYYKAGTEVYHAMEEVRFVTDQTDTVVERLERAEGPSRSLRIAALVADHKRAHA